MCHTTTDEREDLDDRVGAETDECQGAGCDPEGDREDSFPNVPGDRRVFEDERPPLQPCTRGRHGLATWTRIHPQGTR